MRVLILGGTTEASAIARGLAGDGRYRPVLSMAGRTRAPIAPPVPFRVGGFGGVTGLAAYLRQESVAALIDATHPFASRIKANAAEAAALAGVPRVAVLRPGWAMQAGDRWIDVTSMEEAAAALGTKPRRAFLTVGQQELAPFGPPHHYLLRSVDPPPNPPAGATIITARGPFNAADDRALMVAHGIDILVTKNSGGEAVAGKLEAARVLGIPVVMVARPLPPLPPLVPDAGAALDWLHAQAALRGV
jgi:precorrin-6A/cobalt-precorrin-6A reductase